MSTSPPPGPAGREVKLAYPIPKISKTTLINTSALLRFTILTVISAAAIASRLFAVVRHESIIHEFDPWFNYRASKVLVNEGFYVSRGRGFRWSIPYQSS
jgi:dolichyl-diphosphooligosaccharide--protein glycosyltransferase